MICQSGRSPKSWEEQERTTPASVSTPQPAVRTADRVATTEDEDGLVDVVGRLLESAEVQSCCFAQAEDGQHEP